MSRGIPKRVLILILFLLFLPSCAMLFKTHFMDSVNLAALKDGTYIGEDKTLLTSVRLSVTIKGNKIEEIEILRKFITYPLAIPAYNRIPKRIVTQQSLDVDAVTMATISSNSIKRAVLDALNKAQR